MAFRLRAPGEAGGETTGGFMGLFVAALLPGPAFFAMGRPLPGLACLALQASLPGWLPAAVWAVRAARHVRRRRALAVRLGAR